MSVAPGHPIELITTRAAQVYFQTRRKTKPIPSKAVVVRINKEIADLIEKCGGEDLLTGVGGYRYMIPRIAWASNIKFEHFHVFVDRIPVRHIFHCIHLAETSNFLVLLRRRRPWQTSSCPTSHWRP